MPTMPRASTCTSTSQEARSSPQIFSRDLDYLRDMALMWPFILSSIVAVSCAFFPADRGIAIRSAAVAVAAVLLAKERVLLILASLGFIATRGIIALTLHGWNWTVFALIVLTGAPFLVANRRWRDPKLSYRLPNEFGLVDLLWSLASLCGTLALFYFLSPAR